MASKTGGPKIETEYIQGTMLSEKDRWSSSMSKANVRHILALGNFLEDTEFDISLEGVFSGASR